MELAEYSIYYLPYYLPDLNTQIKLVGSLKNMDKTNIFRIGNSEKLNSKVMH